MIILATMSATLKLRFVTSVKQRDMLPVLPL